MLSSLNPSVDPISLTSFTSPLPLTLSTATTFKMSANNNAVHTELTSKDDFENAIKTPGKWVFILAYEGEAPADADE